MKSRLFNLPKYIRGFKNVHVLCLIYSPSRNQTAKIIKNWDKDLCRKMFITAIFIMADNESNLHV